MPVGKQTEKSYTKALYMNDGDWWTVRRTVTEDIAKVPSEREANTLIAQLQKADKL
jgi:hypothetical protein